MVGFINNGLCNEGIINVHIIMEGEAALSSVDFCFLAHGQREGEVRFIINGLFNIGKNLNKHKYV